MSNQARKRLRRHLGLEVNRDELPAFACPGGYPLVYGFRDGGAICPACVNTNVTEIEEASRTGRGRNSHGGWAVDTVEPNYEDANLTCDHCHKPIPAAYVDA